MDFEYEEIVRGIFQTFDELESILSALFFAEKKPELKDVIEFQTTAASLLERIKCCRESLAAISTEEDKEFRQRALLEESNILFGEAQILIYEFVQFVNDTMLKKEKAPRDVDRIEVYCGDCMNRLNAS